MHRMRKQVIFLLLGLLIGTFNGHAGFRFEFDIASTFMWRGFDLYENRPAFQPSVTYAFGDSGLSVNVWASFILEDRDIDKELDEVDFTVNYDFQVSENVSLSVGMINYGYYFLPDYSFKNGNTQELYITAGLPRFILGPVLSVYYDFNLGKGWYVELSVGRAIALTEKLNLEIGASLGYNSKLYIDDSGISDLNVSASLPFSVGRLKITPSVNYTHVYLEPLYYEEGKKDRFWFGANFAID